MVRSHRRLIKFMTTHVEICGRHAFHFNEKLAFNTYGVATQRGKYGNFIFEETRNLTRIDPFAVLLPKSTRKEKRKTRRMKLQPLRKGDYRLNLAWHCHPHQEEDAFEILNKICGKHEQMHRGRSRSFLRMRTWGWQHHKVW